RSTGRAAWMALTRVSLVLFPPRRGSRGEAPRSSLEVTRRMLPPRAAEQTHTVGPDQIVQSIRIVDGQPQDRPRRRRKAETTLVDGAVQQADAAAQQDADAVPERVTEDIVTHDDSDTVLAL